jgi:putative DNA primase/helicase
MPRRDFSACEPALWPAGTFARAYAANRRAAIESIIEADPIATCLRTIMADRTMWMGSASDLMRLYAQSARDDVSTGGAWTKNPRALAGRLRRAQTFLRSLGIEITFSREGRTGSRMIRVSTRAENCVSSVSRVSAAQGNGSQGDQAWLLG